MGYGLKSDQERPFHAFPFERGKGLLSALLYDLVRHRPNLYWSEPIVTGHFPSYSGSNEFHERQAHADLQLHQMSWEVSDSNICLLASCVPSLFSSFLALKAFRIGQKALRNLAEGVLYYLGLAMICLIRTLRMLVMLRAWSDPINDLLRAAYQGLKMHHLIHLSVAHFYHDLDLDW